MVAKGWAYDVICQIGIHAVQIINSVKKYITHAFNKANTVITVVMEIFCFSYCSLGQVE